MNLKVQKELTKKENDLLKTNNASPADTVVESMPNPLNVRIINRRNKQVQSGSKIFTPSGVIGATKNSASNWAYSRIGDKCSYNFQLIEQLHIQELKTVLNLYGHPI